MKIETKGKRSVFFGEVEPGDCFSHSGNPYIRIERVTTKKVSNGSGASEVNAVRLSDGWLGYFKGGTYVTVNPEAKIVVE